MSTFDPGSRVRAAEAVPVVERRSFWRYLVGRRRRFLIDRRYQLRVGAVTGVLVLLLLSLVNLALYSSAQQEAATALLSAPELRPLFLAQDRAQMNLILLGSLVFLAGVFVLSILETHRTAGAAFNIERYLRRIHEGRYGRTVKLRRGDNLRDLERACNDVSLALKSRTLEDVTVLEGLADRVEKARDEAAARALAMELRNLAIEKRRHVE